MAKNGKNAKCKRRKVQIWSKPRSFSNNPSITCPSRSPPRDIPISSLVNVCLGFALYVHGAGYPTNTVKQRTPNSTPITTHHLPSSHPQPPYPTSPHPYFTFHPFIGHNSSLPTHIFPSSNSTLIFPPIPLPHQPPSQFPPLHTHHYFTTYPICHRSGLSTPF